MMIINDLWRRLNVLVPQPQCRTFANDYDRIEWSDSRPKPTVRALLDVPETQIEEGRRSVWVTKAAKRVYDALVVTDPTEPITRAEWQDLLAVVGVIAYVRNPDGSTEFKLGPKG